MLRMPSDQVSLLRNRGVQLCAWCGAWWGSWGFALNIWRIKKQGFYTSSCAELHSSQRASVKSYWVTMTTIWRIVSKIEETDCKLFRERESKNLWEGLCATVWLSSMNCVEVAAIFNGVVHIASSIGPTGPRLRPPMWNHCYVYTICYSWKIADLCWWNIFRKCALFADRSEQ